eukprot:TRINITY_DN10665_c0_g1_i1.p1 TRINITY_DN10665_c0_g1~~TRINITY_DN10665_c0_g1_i1.p1  ORF type:complete len:147 (-),score=6.83 TRINITY_DN10665_c0_g1_i1:161-601(-)
MAEDLCALNRHLRVLILLGHTKNKGCAFYGLPFEIVVEIFRHMSPLDFWDPKTQSSLVMELTNKNRTAYNVLSPKIEWRSVISNSKSACDKPKKWTLRIDESSDFNFMVGISDHPLAEDYALGWNKPSPGEYGLYLFFQRSCKTTQ